MDMLIQQPTSPLRVVWLNAQRRDVNATIAALQHTICSALHELDLSVIEISHTGASSLATALHDNKTLLQLSLRHNQISDDGVSALAVALQHNNSLHKDSICPLIRSTLLVQRRWRQH